MGEVVVVELRDLRPSDLDAMRRREVVEHAVQVHNGELVAVSDHCVVPDWGHGRRVEICDRVAVCISGGGAAWAARADEGLVALAAVDAHPVGGDPRVVALDLLHVSVLQPER